jgi:hypothetical protein
VVTPRQGEDLGVKEQAIRWHAPGTLAAGARCSLLDHGVHSDKLDDAPVDHIEGTSHH